MNDTLVVRIVVAGLVAIVICAMALAALLILDDHPAADVILIAGFGTTALGGLVGMLANTRTVQDPTVATAIDAAREAGVATTEAAVHALASPTPAKASPRKRGT